MGFVRRLSSLVVVATLLAAAASPAFAAPRRHACHLAIHGDCGRMSQTMRCCRGDDARRQVPGGPTEARVQLTPAALTQTVAALLPGVPDLASPSRALHESPPRTDRVDRQSLFSIFLI